MRIIDLHNPLYSESERESQQDYPDEVMKAEWSPVLAEIRSARPDVPELPKPAPAVIDAALLRRYH